jgi:hypothetical protein
MASDSMGMARLLVLELGVLQFLGPVTGVWDGPASVNILKRMMKS